jgi:hypothetical protein
MANELFYGSICVTDLLEKLKSKHSAFKKVASNGKVYADVRIWLNEDEDKYGNVMSIQLASKKEMKDQEGKIYLGNLKRSENQEKPISDKDLDSIVSDINQIDDLPF